MLRVFWNAIIRSLKIPSRAAIRRVLMYFVGLPSEVNLAQTLGNEALVVLGKAQMLENEALVAHGRGGGGPWPRAERKAGGLLSQALSLPVERGPENPEPA